MTLGIGVIGTGAIGQDHIRRVSRALSGGRIVALNDINADNARRAAQEWAPDAVICDTARDLVARPDVQAVMVTSWGGTHAEYVLDAIAAGKPVFCEKPLATNAADCLRIMEAEMARGRRLVQVGFNRRYDSGYLDLKAILDNGTIGDVLMVHAMHRNQRVGPNYKTEMAITDTLVHELDVHRWLLDGEYVSAQVIFPRRTSKALPHMRDPQIALLETKRGIRIDVEIFVNCQYGYDIQCAVVGELGQANLPDPPAVPVKTGETLSRHIMKDWKYRFIDAYDAEIQDFIDRASTGSPAGPDSWAGYAASVAADACVRAQESGRIEPIEMIAKPAFYSR
ncbi:Inositol 2-dehydrogenase [Gluconacetobacter diazotrophicus PA1 5]|uniref:Gfo/Idh/MocA family protein n=1 Tax=Gluconacetobacter diazotrophicus TaxID=33996 RepID=UPI000173DA5A|nr:Gfo/Idh/MocA family oxidoreductase [Gluconacetobacter diazotrophicus]ACI52167.1 Inositol 2-dehydrogenase [Gluconacetobacter diazotrophicus PA1 5]